MPYRHRGKAQRMGASGSTVSASSLIDAWWSINLNPPSPSKLLQQKQPQNSIALHEWQKTRLTRGNCFLFHLFSFEQRDVRKDRTDWSCCFPWWTMGTGPLKASNKGKKREQISSSFYWHAVQVTRNVARSCGSQTCTRKPGGAFFFTLLEQNRLKQ